MYDYFKTGEQEQYQFLQLPWMLIREPEFKKLSDGSKILYSLLLNRISLSIKNGWVDENANVYIIYTIEQITEDLCCGTEKATKILKELKTIGLVEIIRRGQGKPNLLYVKNFATSLKYTPTTPETPINPLIFGNRNSRISEIEILDTGKTENLEFRKSKATNTDLIKNDLTNTDESQSQSQSQGHTKAPQELSTKNKTDKTMTTDDDNSINDSVVKSENKKAPTGEPVSQHRQAEATKYSEGHYNSYKAIIQENIDYGSFTHSRSDISLVDGLVETMLDVICTESPATIKMGDETKSRDLVRSVYLKLKHEHIAHVVDQYKAQHHQITHKGAYMRKMLYTVYQEIDAHYTNQVRADGVVW